MQGGAQASAELKKDEKKVMLNLLKRRVKHLLLFSHFIIATIISWFDFGFLFVLYVHSNYVCSSLRPSPMNDTICLCIARLWMQCHPDRSHIVGALLHIDCMDPFRSHVVSQIHGSRASVLCLPVAAVLRVICGDDLCVHVLAQQPWHCLFCVLYMDCFGGVPFGADHTAEHHFGDDRLQTAPITADVFGDRAPDRPH